MGWRNLMIEEGEFLRLKLDNLYITKGCEEFTIPLEDINMVIMSNLNGNITSRLLDAFTKYNIAFVVCDNKHMPSGIFTGLNTHSRVSKIFRSQLEWTDDFKDYTWQLIIKSKITNQRNVLKNTISFQKGKRIALMDSLLEEVLPGDITNREGHAAKVYFNSLFGMEFKRNDEDDIVNACLNYIYAIVRAFLARLIVAYGMSGLIGVHHKSEYDNFALVDDLMEPFRPFCDQYVIEHLTKESVFDLNMRRTLVNFLNKKIKYKGKNRYISSVMEIYVQTFVKYCNSREKNDFVFPEVYDE